MDKFYFTGKNFYCDVDDRIYELMYKNYYEDVHNLVMDFKTNIENRNFEIHGLNYNKNEKTVETVFSVQGKNNNFKLTFSIFYFGGTNFSLSVFNCVKNQLEKIVLYNNTDKGRTSTKLKNRKSEIITDNLFLRELSRCFFDENVLKFLKQKTDEYIENLMFKVKKTLKKQEYIDFSNLLVLKEKYCDISLKNDVGSHYYFRYEYKIGLKTNINIGRVTRFGNSLIIKFCEESDVKKKEIYNPDSFIPYLQEVKS